MVLAWQTIKTLKNFTIHTKSKPNLKMHSATTIAKSIMLLMLLVAVCSADDDCEATCASEFRACRRASTTLDELNACYTWKATCRQGCTGKRNMRFRFLRNWDAAKY